MVAALNSALFAYQLKPMQTTLIEGDADSAILRRIEFHIPVVGMLQVIHQFLPFSSYYQ